jgi:phenylacetate-coenzyme A ligase PaaK-like adenylate-forming protein
MVLQERFHYPEEFMRRCEKRLEDALAKVPIYKGWAKLDPGPRHSLDDRYDALPVLDKAAMRRSFPNGLVPQEMNLRHALDSGRVEYTFTSGTTSEKVVNVFDQDWWARSERASWRLNAHLARLAYPQRTAKLASALNVGINCEEDLPMSHRILGDTLYLNEKTNIIQWRPDIFPRMARELAEFKPAILEANPSLLARLAFWAMDTGTELWQPKAIVFTFEFSSAIALAAIRKVFASPFVSSYGTTETGFVLEQCEHGLLHQNTEFCRIDFKPLKRSFGGPDVGRIFVTTFDNPWNWIVRFDVGDLVRLHTAGACPCGRKDGMLVDAIEGRIGNVTFTTKGGLVTTKALDDRLARIPQIRDYHFEQHSPRAYGLEVMLTDSSAKTLGSIRSTLKDLYGSDGVYDIAVRANLLPGPAGKFRRTQCNMKFEESDLFG